MAALTAALDSAESASNFLGIAVTSTPEERPRKIRAPTRVWPAHDTHVRPIGGVERGGFVGGLVLLLAHVC